MVGEEAHAPMSTRVALVFEKKAGMQKTATNLSLSFVIKEVVVTSTLYKKIGGRDVALVSLLLLELTSLQGGC